MEQDYHEWDAILRRENGAADLKTSVVSKSLPHYCLTSILINLNQLLYLFRYKRDEFPKSVEFRSQYEERQKWESELGEFGFALLDNNIRTRLDNIGDATKPLPAEKFPALHQHMHALLATPSRVSTEDIRQLIQLIKTMLAKVDVATDPSQFRRGESAQPH